MNKTDSVNNGGKTDYYQLSSAPFPINVNKNVYNKLSVDIFIQWTLNIFYWRLKKKEQKSKIKIKVFIDMKCQK